MSEQRKGKRKMKKAMWAWAVLLVIWGVWCATAEAREPAKITIKIASLQPKGSALMKILAVAAEKLKKETNNEVAFKFYWGGVQGDETDVLRKMRTGQLHGGGFSGHGLSEIVPAMKILEAPFLFRNGDEFSYVHARLEDTLNRYFEEKGFVVLAWTDLGFIYIFANAPITSPEILKKQKIWAWGYDPVIYAIFKEGLGIEPIPLSLTDVMTALSTNLVDTVCLTPFHVVAFRWHTDLKYLADVPLFRGVGAFLVTKDMWDKISPESQSKIMKVLRHVSEETNTANREANEKATELLIKAGVSILPPRDLDYLVKSGEKARESLVGKGYSRELLDRTLSLVEEYRRDHPNSTFQRLEESHPKK
jgi:TRAP-type C4-dicarboxylate transport system substrate-binding protein